MTCRHFLPRFDLPLGQTLHGLGRFVVAHPTSTAALVLLPLCATILLLVYRDLRGPVVARWHGGRHGASRRLPGFIDDGFGPAHSG